MNVADDMPPTPRIAAVRNFTIAAAAAVAALLGCTALLRRRS